MAFSLHARLAADTIDAGQFPLCRLLMMNDAQYPWFILVPQRDGLREIHDLPNTERLQFWNESAQLSEALMTAFSGHKLNVAALGNMVPQLHVHHIVRFPGDPAWPHPVWGRLPAQPLNAAIADSRLASLRPLLGQGYTPG